MNWINRSAANWVELGHSLSWQKYANGVWDLASAHSVCHAGILLN